MRRPDRTRHPALGTQDSTVIDDAADFDNQDAGAGGGMPPGRGDAGNGDSPDDLVGAYLLDALTEDERAAFETHLRTSEAARREVAQLRPVVDLLPLVLETRHGDPRSAEVTPSSDLRDRIVAAVRAEAAGGDATDAGPSDAAEPTISAVQPATTPSSVAPRGAPTEPEPVALRPTDRGRPGARTVGTGPIDFVSRIGWSGLAAAVLGLIAAGALIWAFSLQRDLDDKNDEIADLQTVEAGSGGVTLAYIMQPTADGPATARGALSWDPGGDSPANLTVLGLTPLPENEIYQLWFVDVDAAGNPTAARPSVTFRVDDQGTGMTEVPVPVEPFDIVALTAEPVDAVDDTPNPPILMTGARGTAAG